MSDSDDCDSVNAGLEYNIEREPQQHSATQIHIEINESVRRYRDLLDDAVQLVQESVRGSNTRFEHYERHHAALSSTSSSAAGCKYTDRGIRSGIDHECSGGPRSKAPHALSPNLDHELPVGAV